MMDTVQINSKLDIVRALREEKAELDKQKKAEESRIKYFYDAEYQKLEEKEQAIIDEITGAMDLEGKTKVTCINGTISRRKSPAKFEYGDDLLKELKDKGYNQYIRIKEEVDKMTLKSEVIVDENGNCFTEAGEEIEGVKVTEGDYTWAVKINA